MLNANSDGSDQNLLKQRLEAAVERGEMIHDTAQHQLAVALDELASRLLSIPPKPKRRFWQRVRVQPIQGFYIQGDVGRGKTLLCDWFIAAYSPEVSILRLHFHRFMDQIHSEIRAQGAVEDPLRKIAAIWAGKARCLVLDEMQVNDITDAMLMAKLFEALFAEGVVLLATSNLTPDELYLGGLQRARFLACIELIKIHTQVFELGDGEDYRRRTLAASGVGFVDQPQSLVSTLDKMFVELSGQTLEAAEIDLFGRRLRLRAEHADTAYFDFDSLCRGHRSARDYVELATIYGTILLGPCPQMNDMDLDPLRRFINLVDALYDHGSKLVLGTTVPLEMLYIGERLAFPFARCLSRLIEMQSAQYLHRPHRSDSPMLAANSKEN